MGLVALDRYQVFCDWGKTSAPLGWRIKLVIGMYQNSFLQVDQPNLLRSDTQVATNNY
jgi:hypothetical protein